MNDFFKTLTTVVATVGVLAALLCGGIAWYTIKGPSQNVESEKQMEVVEETPENPTIFQRFLQLLSASNEEETEISELSDVVIEDGAINLPVSNRNRDEETGTLEDEFPDGESVVGRSDGDENSEDATNLDGTHEFDMTSIGSSLESELDGSESSLEGTSSNTEYVDGNDSQEVALEDEIIENEDDKSAKKVDPMTVHFIDLQDGEATLISCGTHHMLIDCGADPEAMALMEYLDTHAIKKLDYLILTHPDEKHTAGAATIINEYRIGQIYVTNYNKNSVLYSAQTAAMQKKGYAGVIPQTRVGHDLGTSTFEFVSPAEKFDDPDEAALCVRLVHGNKSFLFMSDNSKAVQKRLIRSGIELQANVYKASNHGANNGYLLNFMYEVNPDAVVISSNRGNVTGDPGTDLLYYLEMTGVDMYRTDEQGTIIATSTGRSIIFNRVPSTTFVTGDVLANGGKEPKKKRREEAVTEVSEGAEDTSNDD